MKTLADAFIEYLNQVGIFSFFIPLLLVWVLLYLVFINVPGLKEEKYKPILSMLALLFAFIVVMFPTAVRVLQYAVAVIVLFVIFSVFTLLFYSFIGAGKEDAVKDLLTGLIKSRLFQIMLILTFTILILFATNLALTERSGGGYVPFYQILAGNYTDPYYAGIILATHPAIIGSILMLVLIGIFMYLMITPAQKPGGQ